MGRGLREAGKVARRDETGASRGPVTWEGRSLKPGQGRKLDEATWKARKGSRGTWVDRPEKETQAAPYREVDYLSGARYLYRNPESGEVVFPKPGRGPGGRKRRGER